MQMILLYISIPLMVIAIAIAMAPLLATMRREELARRQASAFAESATALEDRLEDARYRVAA
ncbi:MAG TPA: hypothetical protein VMD28_08150 [Acidimicrobiales bacterium]|nr:hypothetical protein [Acidimicrobiales bacterium]